MFGRAAAWGIAAFLVVMPAACGIDGNASADVDDSTASIGALPASVEGTFKGGFEVQARPVTRQRARSEDGAAPELAALGAPEQSRSSLLAEPFALPSVPVTDGEILAKWQSITADIRADTLMLARCRNDLDQCPAAARNFLAIIAEGRAHSGRARIGVINRAINLAIRPTSDLDQWGVPDRWSAPLVTLTTGRGDCEDYAIAKYVALMQAGIAAEDLRLVIVRNAAAGEDHAVVAVRFDGSWIMLDNRWLALVEDSDVSGIVPRFVLGGDGVRQFMPEAVAVAVAAARRASAPASLGF